MEINEELLACYIEGTATAEEQEQVRQYLCKHPEENMHILCLMDEDTEDYLNEFSEDSCDIIPFDSSISDIACSAAAFAPQQRKQRINSMKIHQVNKIDYFNRNLGKLSHEL